MQKLAAALVAFRAKCPPVVKDSVNPHFNSKFASLDAIHRAIDPILADHDLMVMQFPIGNGVDAAGCRTIVLHASGESIEHEFLVPVAKADPQKACAAVSYARRYGISGALGLVTEDDDDGNSAAGAGPAPAKPQAKGGAFLDEASAKKMLFAAKERLKELGVEPTDAEAGKVCGDVLHAHGYSSRAQAKQADFAKMFSAVQEWSP